MKSSFVFGILFAACINTSLLATNDKKDSINQTRDTITIVTPICVSQSEISDSNELSSQNSFSNQNDNFALYSIIIAVFGIFVGVIITLSTTLFTTRKEGIKEFMKSAEKELRDKVEEINRIRDKVEEKTNEVDNLTNRQAFQNQYLTRINQYLFSITNSVVDSYGGDNETATGIRHRLYNHYYIVKVFLPWSDSPTDGTEAVFRYLQVNGKEENINDLQCIVENDPDERKRKMALETIGFIKARLMNDKAS